MINCTKCLRVVAAVGAGADVNVGVLDDDHSS